VDGSTSLSQLAETIRKELKQTVVDKEFQLPCND